MKNKYIDLLQRRPGYRNLWLASLVSLLGDWFNTIASVMIVNRYTETDLAISWILIARTLPRFLIGPFAGVLADRVNRKVIMIVRRPFSRIRTICTEIPRKTTSGVPRRL